MTVCGLKGSLLAINTFHVEIVAERVTIARVCSVLIFIWRNRCAGGATAFAVRC